MVFNDTDYQNMAKVYSSGVTLADLASQFSVSIPTMSKYVKKGGAVVRPRGQRKQGLVEMGFPAEPTPVVAIQPGEYYTTEQFEMPAPLSRTILPME